MRGQFSLYVQGIVKQSATNKFLALLVIGFLTYTQETERSPLETVQAPQLTFYDLNFLFFGKRFSLSNFS